MPGGGPLGQEAVHPHRHPPVRQEKHRRDPREVNPLPQVEAAPALQPVRQGRKGLRLHHGGPHELPAVLVEVAVLRCRLPVVHPPRQELPYLRGVVGPVGRRVLVLDLSPQDAAVVVIGPQARICHGPQAPVVGVRSLGQLPYHHEIPVVSLRPLQEPLSVGLLPEAWLILRIVTGGGDDAHEALPPLPEGVQLDIP